MYDERIYEELRHEGTSGGPQAAGVRGWSAIDDVVYVHQ